MGVFDDKKYEELDWISQAIEPINSQIDVFLGTLPDTIEFDFNKFCEFVGDGSWYVRLDTSKVVSYYINQLGKWDLTYQQQELLTKQFKLEVEGEPVINFLTREITGGSIRAVKINQTIDPKSLEKLLGQSGLSTLRYIRTGDPGFSSRANDIMEILGKCEAGIRSRSDRNKTNAIYDRMKALFAANEWNIKDMELADRVSKWIADYVQNGNLASYSNFCKLKVMTHKGQPIYSMEEVE